MLIRRLRIQNLHSLRSVTEIDFTANPLASTGLFAITGDTGAGKTTILDGLTLALYGKICRNSDEKEAISYGSEEGAAECEFEAKGRRFLAQWSIRRRKSKKENNFHVERTVAEWVADEDGFIIRAKKITEANQYIEEVTGLDFGRFTRSVLLAQGDFATFLKAAPKERSDLLERITGTEIYSELSKGALLRFREEEAKLKELINQKEALMIFSKEEIKVKKSQLKELESGKKETRQKLEDSKAGLVWLKQLEALKAKRNKAREELAQIESEKIRLQPEFNKLSRHQQTIPFQNLLARYDEKLVEIEQFESSLIGLRTEFENLENQKVEAEVFVKSSLNELEAAKASQPGYMKLFDEVANLDTVIQNIASNLQRLTSESTKQEQELTATEGRLKDLGSDKTSLEVTLENSVSWLQENKKFASLPQELSSIELLRDQLRVQFSNRRAIQAEKENWMKKLANAIELRDRASLKLKGQKSQLENLTQAFKKSAPEEFSTSRQELLEKLTQDIEQLGDLQKNYNLLKNLNDEYNALLQELSALELSLDNLRKEEAALDKSLLSVMEETDEWGRQLNFKQEIYNQQLRIANYEKDRAQLKENEPCPLCFSTHHPYRTHAIVPFTDEAQKELQAVQRQYQLSATRQKELLIRHRETSLKIGQITGFEVGALDKLRARLQECESKMAALMPGWSEEEIARTYGNWFTQRLAEFENNLSAKKASRVRLNELHQKLVAEEKNLQLLDNELKEHEFELIQTQNSLQHHDRLLKDAETQFSDAVKEMDKRLKKYGHSFTEEGANGIFQELAAKAGEFIKHQTNIAECKKQLELNEHAMSQLLENRASLALKFDALQKAISTENAELKRLQDKRGHLFGAKDPKSEREEFLKKLDTLGEDHLKARNELEAVKTGLAGNKQAILSGEQGLVKVEKALTETKDNLLKGIQKIGFDSIESLRAAIMSDEEAMEMEGKAKELQHQVIASKQLLATLEKELATNEENPLTQKQPLELQTETERFEKELEKIEQNIGGIRQQLTDNDSRKAKAKTLLDQIELQRKDYNRWEALYNLIGSADGKKFRIFAQGLTLQKLVLLANRHLAKLFGRYLIIKRKGEDLELDIVDTYQADNIRSMLTLSGGESFLVSLALALGLSDLAGRDANIRSLFIDEGFGTLDEQTLDLVISTLENLQASGKTIGIISHVKELKERIATQIRVVKKGGGVSVVEVIG